jgi:hypothetical protein
MSVGIISSASTSRSYLSAEANFRGGNRASRREFGNVDARKRCRESGATLIKVIDSALPPAASHSHTLRDSRLISAATFFTSPPLNTHQNTLIFHPKKCLLLLMESSPESRVPLELLVQQSLVSPSWPSFTLLSVHWCMMFRSRAKS